VKAEGSQIITEYGPHDGKKQVTTKEAKAKNVGRSNETTPSVQAEKEAKSMWQNKLDRKYRLTIEEAKKPLPLPMLAKKFEDRKKKVTYPVDLQPKFDGCRSLAQWEGDKVELTSRSGKPYNCPHIIEELEKVLPKNIILDGELYVHGETFQEVTRLVKKVRPESKKLQLWTYDIIDRTNMDLEWKDRAENLLEFFNKEECKTLIYVPSVVCNNEEEVYNEQARLIQEGYEGAIVRLLDGKYIWGYRSDALLKVKTFQDEEFKVVGYKPGIGKFSEACIWLCKTETGLQFEVVSKGTMEYRKELLADAEKYLNLMLKVKFFERTESGIPRFPVGLGFRLPEDM
jgi:DNA ligase-1